MFQASEDKVLLSIVIPVFNTAGYLGKCLRSLGIDDHLPRVEVIIVDDGSTDDSAIVISAIKKWFTGLIVISQENSGLGAARNAGLIVASGTYVWFVDSDDFLKPSALQQIILSLSANSPDVLVLDFSCADEDGQAIDWIRADFREDSRTVMTGGEFFCRHYQTTYAWIYIFRRKLLSDNNLKFQPRINMQDAEFLPRVLAVATKVIISDIDAYVYVKRPGSFINSCTAKVRERYFLSVIEVHKRLNEFSQSADLDKQLLLGLKKKVNMLRQILFLSWVYEHQTGPERTQREKVLRDSGLFPMKFTIVGPLSSMPKIWTLRVLSNLVGWRIGAMYASARTIFRSLFKSFG